MYSSYIQTCNLIISSKLLSSTESFIDDVVYVCLMICSRVQVCQNLHVASHARGAHDTSMHLHTKAEPIFSLLVSRTSIVLPTFPVLGHADGIADLQ